MTFFSNIVVVVFVSNTVFGQFLKPRDDPSTVNLVISSIIVVPSQEPVTVTITSTSSSSSSPSVDTSVEPSPTAAEPPVNTDTDNPSDNCGFGTVNVANWESSGIDSWFANFGESHTGQSPVAALAHEYAPNVAQSAINCDVSDECSPISCELLDLSHSDTKQAFFTLEAIANFNNMLKTIIDGITAASTLANSFTDQWVQLFSFVPELDHALAQRNFLIDILSDTFSFLLTFGGLYGAIASAATSFIFAGVKDSLGDPPQEFDAAADLGAFIGNLTNTSITSITNLGTQLFKGNADTSGNHLWQYLANGSFADTNPLKSSQIASFLNKQYISAGIQALWTSQRTYIIETPLINGVSCANDARGPAESKLCSAALPSGMVYYAYMIPPTPGNYPQVTLPQGWQNLTAYPGLDLVTAMQSSVLAYHVAGFGYEGVRDERWIEAIGNASRGAGTSPVDQGYGFEGTFTLPVCGDPKGNFVSQINTNSHRRYPCQCSPATGSSSDPNAETIPFLYAAGMMNDKVWYGYCNDGSQGQGCTDPQTEGMGQNVTFRSCPLKNAGVKGLDGSSWGFKRWWIWGVLWCFGVWFIEF